MANVFTIPPDVPFLPALARAILGGGFPRQGIAPPGPMELPRWTLLLPTRRAARQLQRELLKASGTNVLLMPAIRPIGDVDEDELAFDDIDMPDAIPALGREYLLTRLVNEWAEANPQQRLAAEISASPAHTLALAQSLARFVDGVETEEATLAGLEDLFAREFSAHHEAILGFLDIVRRRMPEELNRLQLLGPFERRSKLIDLAAERLKRSPPAWPVIAAGSTGSIPATARLIGVIAGLEHGAAILPGLDTGLDDANWNQVSETHPQFGLKRLVETLKVDRKDVGLLPHIGERNAPRTWLAGEAMRPKEMTGGWSQIVENERARLAAACAGLRLVAARTRAEEAEAIALLMREALEIPGKTVALVTPDRQLAARVRAALTRWNVVADDTAGEPLIDTAPGSFLAALIDVVQSEVSAPALATLIRHRMLSGDAGAARHFELALLRGRSLGWNRPFSAALAGARREIGKNVYSHLSLKRVSDEEWSAAAEFAKKLDRALAPLRVHAQQGGATDLAAHIDAIAMAAQQLSDSFSAAPDDAASAVRDMLREMREQSVHHPPGRFDAAVATIMDQLRRRVVRARFGTYPRLAIYGLLEARLMHADTVILGGLNEGKWPAQPDPGPWLNRPMREALALMAPEREIGLTAHDFVQAFGNRDAVLTWSARIGGAPALPSRWILRLKLLLEAIDKWKEMLDGRHLAWARALDQPAEVRPVSKPAPRPPRAARPRRISISRVEELIRDPYATYARQVLRLEPLDGLGAAADPRLRGELIHRVLELYHRRYPSAPPSNIEQTLLEIGDEVFAPHRDDAEIAALWLPRFRRIAVWFAEFDAELRADVEFIAAECEAEHDLMVAGEAFKLIGRADRIDLLKNGTARILDFKTGDPPGKKEVELGLSPQLTLEAALLDHHAFSVNGIRLAAMKTSSVAYVKLTGGIPPGSQVVLGETVAEVMPLAEAHLAGLVQLLGHYADPATPYLPRHQPKREEYESTYDHLSRWREWATAATS